MDLDQRLLLYLVVFGSVVGIGIIVHRRALALRMHGFQLVAIAAAALTGLFRDDVGSALAWPLFVAWALVAMLPTLLVQAARRAAGQRGYGLAWRLTAFASGLLLLPATIRREARVYAALDAADRGDEAACRARLDAIVRACGPTVSPETSDLVRFLPAVAGRRFHDLLAAVDASSVRSPIVLAAEASAASETGDLRRALRAVNALGTVLRNGAPALSQARRTVLAAAGRVAFLEEAIRRRMPVASGPRGAAAVALARA
ncbi:MAG: hypothetical protein K8T90_06120, partial [Planctomycetes bacterium]|nr:hypothetical protein [Planctomycetota bacterium]